MLRGEILLMLLVFAGAARAQERCQVRIVSARDQIKTFDSILSYNVTTESSLSPTTTYRIGFGMTRSNPDSFAIGYSVDVECKALNASRVTTGNLATSKISQLYILEDGDIPLEINYVNCIRMSLALISDFRLVKNDNSMDYMQFDLATKSLAHLSSQTNISVKLSLNRRLADGCLSVLTIQSDKGDGNSTWYDGLIDNKLIEYANNLVDLLLRKLNVDRSCLVLVALAILAFLVALIAFIVYVSFCRRSLSNCLVSSKNKSTSDMGNIKLNSFKRSTRESLTRTMQCVKSKPDKRVELLRTQKRESKLNKNQSASVEFEQISSKEKSSNRPSSINFRRCNSLVLKQNDSTFRLRYKLRPTLGQSVKEHARADLYKVSFRSRSNKLTKDADSVAS